MKQCLIQDRQANHHHWVTIPFTKLFLNHLLDLYCRFWFSQRINPLSRKWEHSSLQNHIACLWNPLHDFMHRFAIFGERTCIIQPLVIIYFFNHVMRTIYVSETLRHCSILTNTFLGHNTMPTVVDNTVVILGGGINKYVHESCKEI